MTKQQTVKILFIATGLIFILGIILILSSSAIGRGIAQSILERQQDYGMDTDQFLLIIADTTVAYRTAGLVISLISGIGFLASIFTWLAPLERK